MLPSEPARQINVGFWNLQRLFAAEGSAIAAELGVNALNGWDRRALEARLISLSAAIRSLFQGHGADLLGLAELEGTDPGQQLLEMIDRDDYALIVADDAGLQASDTALIYSTRVFENEPVVVKTHCIHRRFATCDILEVTLIVRATGTPLTVFVNHWPSRNEAHSDALRRALAVACAECVSQTVKYSRSEFLELSDTEVSRFQVAERWNADVLVMGSFNDPPWDVSLSEILNANRSLRAVCALPPFPAGTLPSWRSYASVQPMLFNPSWSLLADPDSGTLSSDRGLEIHDQILLSRGLVTGANGIQATTDGQGPMLAIQSPGQLACDQGRPLSYDSTTLEGFSDRLPVGLSLGMVPQTDHADNVATVSSN